ncbi:ROK family protein [Cohnella yongneupensis]|uniref:ROK family protein n=1 Tax=Cohnella yongneupensis TaxID=425006 RepID=A0ABW0R4F4_9BACL
MNSYAIVFDVGGLYIKTAVLNGGGQVVPDTYMIYPSKSKASMLEILTHIVDLARRQASRIIDKEYRIEGIGFAFPGPFDYDNGISYIQGVDKFESIYGVNLRRELMARLERDPIFARRMTEDFQIVFENDANLFALGEYAIGKAGKYDKSLCVTIGTGAGSAFLDNGELVKSRGDVPENGWIYNRPFRASIVDDYISKRGIVRLIKEAGFEIAELDVKLAAELAKAGDEQAIGVFRRFGESVAEMLVPFIQDFRPDAVVIGGQIVKSQELFIDSIQEALQPYNVVLEVTDETSVSTFAGVSRLLEQKKYAKSQAREA